jgi:LPS export ABC transporter ATP-binding protein
MYKRAQMGIGYLPQEASVFRKLSVEDNILAVLEMTKLNKQQQKEKLETLLDEFNLQRVRKNNGDTLSGGERRRTEIARALAVDPKFILLDEPFAGVDPIAVEDIQAIVAKLKFRNIGILITDHNVNETLSICDRAYLLIDGKIFTQGTAEELANDEQVRRLYLGKNFELKRKDYLHDEAAISSSPSLENIIRSLESNIAAVENIINEQKADSRSFGYQQKNITEYESFKNFHSSFNENFDFLNGFAEKNNLPEVKEKIDSLKLFDGTIDNFKSDLSTIVFYLKAFKDN